ncbi:MAG: hypothetical protein ABI134_30680 [Byssovorax sp.]
MSDLSPEEIESALEAYRKDEGRWASAQERLAEITGIWTTTFDIMAAFAAPRVLARLPAELPGEHETRCERIAGLFDAYIELVTGEKSGEKFNGEDFHRTLEPTRRARALLATWVVSEEAPALLVQAARDFFAAFGWAEPEGGWEAWEGTAQE